MARSSTMTRSGLRELRVGIDASDMDRTIALCTQGGFVERPGTVSPMDLLLTFTGTGYDDFPGGQDPLPT